MTAIIPSALALLTYVILTTILFCGIDIVIVIIPIKQMGNCGPERLNNSPYFAFFMSASSFEIIVSLLIYFCH